MKLSWILESPHAAWIHAERYVNDGSPSGYHRIHSVTPPYRAAGAARTVDVPLFRVGSAAHILRSGAAPTRDPMSVCDNLLPVHPDMLANDAVLAVLANAEHAGALTCAPTSSERTLFVLDAGRPQWCVKLHYDALLGRFTRPLDLRRIRGALAVNADLHAALDRLPEGFSFLPESAALWLPSDESDKGGVGAIMRELAPPRMMTAHVLLPCFALFSQDRLSPSDPVLLRQLLDPGAPLADFIESLVRPVLGFYWFLCVDLGLIPEWNAQNLLVSIGPEGRISGIVMRDLQGTYRDIEYRPKDGLALETTPYKVLDPSSSIQGRFRGQQQRSYLYDFKLGEYVLMPLARALCREFGIDLAVTVQAIRATAMSIMRSLALDEAYFPPSGVWYRQRDGISSKQAMFVPGSGSPPFR